MNAIERNGPLHTTGTATGAASTESRCDSDPPVRGPDTDAALRAHLAAMNEHLQRIVYALAMRSRAAELEHHDAALVRYLDVKSAFTAAHDRLKLFELDVWKSEIGKS